MYGVLECFVVVIGIVDVICGGFVAFLEREAPYATMRAVRQAREKKDNTGDLFW